MSQVEAAALASLRDHRGAWGTIRRIGALRLFVMGFILLTAFGFSMAFHFEYLHGHMAFAYSPVFDWSASLFGLMHAGSHGATTFSTVAVALEAGGMLAAAYVWSRSLWLPIGIHLAWNATQGGLFSAPISGGAARGLLNFRLSPAAGPLITGGDFGPEASIVALCVCVSLGLVFVVLAIRSGRWRGLRFRVLLD
jgi:membrane protease YdiL (CAAX protease family)